MSFNLKKTTRKNKNRGLKKRITKHRNTRKRIMKKNRTTIKSKFFSRKRKSISRRFIKGGGCCGENNFYSGKPYNPGEWTKSFNPIQTFYRHNKNVIDPPVQEGKGLSGGGLLPYDITNVARGMMQGIKSGYYGLKGVPRSDNMYVWPEQQPSLENENNQPKPIPEPIDIEKIHSNAASQI